MPEIEGTETAVSHPSPLASLQEAIQNRAVITAMTIGLFLFFTFGGFSTIWAIWISDSFGLGTIEIGFVATTVSLAELAGVLFSLFFIDRIGKKVVVRSGFILAIILFSSWLLLPHSLLTGRLNLMLLGGILETTIVSFFPLISDQLPTARATLFSLVILGVSVGLALGPPVTLFLWEQFGLTAIVLAMIIVLSLATFLVSTQIKEGQPT